MIKPLETERLILRKFAEDDLFVFHRYASCAENTVYTLWGPKTEEQTKAFIIAAIAKGSENPCTHYQYAVMAKDTEQLIGACSLALSDHEAEMGWFLHQDFWKQGYGTEMGKALLQYGFEELNLHRICARCDAEHTASYRVMEKIGMRREGLFIESRPAHKLSSLKYGDELSYAIVKGEWETYKEIEYYNALPCMFNDFIDLPVLSDGIIHLVCARKNPAVPEKNWVPSYNFFICIGSEKIGQVNLRVGYRGGQYDSSLYYGGQVGYHIHEEHRGNNYAVRACRLLLPVARAHRMEKLLITNSYTNVASRRVCQKLGARLLRVARLPQWHDLYEQGQRLVNIFEWSVT